MQNENFILSGNLHVEPKDATMKNFQQIYGCKNIVKEKFCFKDPMKPTCNDFIIDQNPSKSLRLLKLGYSIPINLI